MKPLPLPEFPEKDRKPKGQLYIKGGKSGPFMIIDDEPYLSCPVCKRKYDLKKFNERDKCLLVREKTVWDDDGSRIESVKCTGRLVRCGKPVEGSYGHEVMTALKWEMGGKSEKDRLGRRYWQKWFTMEGAERRMMKFMEREVLDGS